MTEYQISSQSEMAELAKNIAKNAKNGNIFAINGTLGVGKTFFARNFINSLCNEEIEVLSPTFSIVYSYETKKGEVFHFDLYRIEDEKELENIGFSDAMRSGICLIEWPKIAEKFLPKNCKKIEIKTAPEIGEEARIVTVL